MSIQARTTPSHMHPGRKIFERATRRGATARVESIKLDTVIDDIANRVRRGYIPFDEAAELLDDYLASSQKAYDSIGHQEHWTDVQRLSTSRHFAVERAFLPLLSERSDEESIARRQDLCDGIVGKTFELLNPVLDELATDELVDSRFSYAGAEKRSALRGWVQEMTVMALVNYPENDAQIALPASTTDDLIYNTDLLLYQNADRYRVSVKTMDDDAKVEKIEHPEIIVLSAQRFHNLGLNATKLLQIELAGYPGLGEAQEYLLHGSRNIILQDIESQARCIEPET